MVKGLLLDLINITSFIIFLKRVCVRLSSCKLLTTTLASKKFVCNFYDILFFFKPIFFLPKNSKIQSNLSSARFARLARAARELHNKHFENAYKRQTIYEMDFSMYLF